MTSNVKDRLVGRPVPRKEGRAKVTGAALYVDDLVLPGMLHGVTVRSTIPRGRIKEVVFDPSIPWDEFTVVTARDVPGENAVALILLDQPYLAEAQVNHPEEPVLLLAHEDKHLLEEARRAVRIEYETLPAVFTIEDSLAAREVIWGGDNVFKSFLVEKGDVDAALKQPDLVVVEGVYRTGAQEQLYIETNGVVATYDAGEGVTVRGSMQCPYYVHKALVKLFGLPPERVRVIQTETGGGFGGKEEYPSMIAGHAALLALKSGRPVKMVYDRAEDMAATTKRHPSRTRHRTAVTREGRLVSMEIDFDIDGGAYATLSSVVLSRGTIHAAGPYDCPNVRVRSRAVATNAPPHGAFRGFGAPQSIFALERHLDRVAAALGLAPEELRRRNFIGRGDTTATGQVVRDDVDLAAILRRAFELSDFEARRARFARENPSRRVKRGVGFATFMHGAGFTGSGEKFLQSVVGCEATPEGRVRVLAASTEIGQGTNTIFAQIAAEALGLDYEEVEVARPDTGNVPDSGPTVASRTCMIVGKLVETSAQGIKQILRGGGFLGEDYTAEEFRRACRAHAETIGPLKVLTRYEQPADVSWDDQLYRGDAYSAFAWAAYVAEVSVDSVTYEARVEDFVAVQEVGRVIHPVLAAGQIEGGVAQGIGWSLYERVAWREGRMANSQMTNYIIPTAADVPPIRVHFFENPFPGGPSGAKGIGELPMDGPAPAIAAALEQATGHAFDHVPVTPEEIMEALERP